MVALVEFGTVPVVGCVEPWVLSVLRIEINSTDNISVLYLCLRAPRDAVIDSDWSLKFGTLRIKASSFQKLLVVAHGLEQLGNH